MQATGRCRYFRWKEVKSEARSSCVPCLQKKPARRSFAGFSLSCVLLFVADSPSGAGGGGGAFAELVGEACDFPAAGRDLACISCILRTASCCMRSIVSLKRCHLLRLLKLQSFEHRQQFHHMQHSGSFIKLFFTRVA